MKTASWNLIAVAATLTLLGGLVSIGIAYGSGQDQIGPVTLQELSAGRADVATALRGAGPPPAPTRPASARCCSP
jgi:hypothetical protein